MLNKTAAQQYKNNNIVSAGPEESVLMLYDGAIRFMKMSAVCIAKKNRKKKIVFIEKTLKIVDYLQACLDMQKGGEIAKNLNDLYDYILIELTKANLKDDIRKIQEIINLLLPVRDAWAGICRNKKAAAPAQAAESFASPYGKADTPETKRVAVSV
jgi:flagellar protein FliS